MVLVNNKHLLTIYGRELYPPGMTGRIKVRITAARVRGSPGAVLTITIGLHFTDAGTDLKFPNENMPWRYILAQYW